MTEANVKAALHFAVNLAVNGSVLAFVPEDWKPLALLVFNLAQVVLAFLDPSYAIQKLGMTKGEYLGKVK